MTATELVGCLQLALRVVSLRCIDLSAFGAKRTLACHRPERMLAECLMLRASCTH